MKDIDLKALLKRVVELVMPDLRAYYRVVRKAKIVKSYASDGRYWADLQPLRNDESVDENEPVIPRVEIPVMWAGPKRGVVCPPISGVHCDLEYYDGDPDYPRISNFRWYGMKAPGVEVGGFIIQHSDGTYIKIDASRNIIHVTPANKINQVGGSKHETVAGAWVIEVGGSATIKAPQINLEGNLSASGAGGETGTSSEKANKTQDGNFTLNGNLEVNGNIHATGTIIDDLGNTANHSGH